MLWIYWWKNIFLFRNDILTSTWFWTFISFLFFSLDGSFCYGVLCLSEKKVCENISQHEWSYCSDAKEKCLVSSIWAFHNIASVWKFSNTSGLGYFSWGNSFWKADFISKASVSEMDLFKKKVFFLLSILQKSILCHFVCFDLILLFIFLLSFCGIMLEAK